MPRMSDALAALRSEAPTQETRPLRAVPDEDSPQAAATVLAAAPGRYLAADDNGELVLYALGTREGQSLHIGRSPVSDILLDDASVSRKHAVLVHRGGHAVLLDDRSLNGIYVNGQRVSEAVLNDGDWIAVGQVSLRYVEVTGG
jgi:pSer/pThr/pTyr-binding forkhead associated (FHA) protein